MRSGLHMILLSMALGVMSVPGFTTSVHGQQEAVRPDEAPAKPPAPERSEKEASSAQAPADKSKTEADIPGDPAGDAAAESADRTKAKEANEAAEKPAEEPAEKPAEKSAEKTTGRSADAAPEKRTLRRGDRSTERRNEKSSKETPAKSETKSEPRQEVRLLELSGAYADLLQPLGFDATSLIAGTESLKQKSFYKLCDYLEELGEDKNVAHVVFDLSDSGLEMNPAQLDEITRRLEKLKAAGKHTFAWLENPGNVQLALAVACDEVVLADFGGVDMPSMSMQSIFYRDAMDLLGIQASVVRAGDFKGAVEPYINPQMSEHLREHYLEMLTTINDAQVDRIARGRGLTSAQVRELQKQRLLLPEQALAEGLVDHLAAYGSMKTTIDEMIGKSLDWTKPKAAPRREMSVFELLGRVMSGDKKPTSTVKEDTIAVLHLSGAIVDGKKASPGSIVSGPTVKAIEDIAKDDKIKAVVIRINSPGGSATASEAVRRALAALAEKKPTMVSMGEMAASGGYWISCIGQPIYAERGTITGSIGVFSLKISVGSLMRRVGVHVESIALDDTAKSDNIDRPWSEHDINSMQDFVDDVYSKFVCLVSDSRSLSVETVEELAGGRVWSGTQAKANKLIDKIGGLDDCLNAIAKKAKLENYNVIHRPVVKSGFDLLELLGEEDPTDVELNSLLQLQPQVLQMLTRQGFDLDITRLLLRTSLLPHRPAVPNVWALCPNELSVR